MFEDIMRLKDREEVITSEKQATDYLEEFLALTNLPKLGDYVQRNKFGMRKYKFPVGNRVGKVVAVYDPPIFDDDAHCCDGLIATAHPDGEVTFDLVNLRFFETKKPVKGKNVFSFKGGR